MQIAENKIEANRKNRNTEPLFLIFHY